MHFSLLFFWRKELIANHNIIKLFLKTKIKLYGDEVTDFYDKEVLKVDSNQNCLAVIRMDSTLNKDQNYYP